MQTFTVLIVEDFAPFREIVSALLLKTGRFDVVDQASDGLEAIQKAKAWQPDFILLDIGLPNMNGLEAANRIAAVAPNSRIVFLSQDRDLDIVKASLSTGARGYVVKSDAGSDLLEALATVAQGKTFLSASLGPSSARSLRAS